MKELEKKELLKIQGGYWALVLSAAIYIADNWSDIQEGWNNGGKRAESYLQNHGR